MLCLHHGRCECGNVVVVKVQRVGVNQSRFLGAGLSLGASQPEHNWTSHWIQGLGGFLLHFHLYLYFLLYFYLSLGTRLPDSLSIKKTSHSSYEKPPPSVKTLSISSEFLQTGTEIYPPHDSCIFRLFFEITTKDKLKVMMMVMILFPGFSSAPTY